MRHGTTAQSQMQRARFDEEVRAFDREQLALLHDTVASTLLMVGRGVSLPAGRLAAQAYRHGSTHHLSSSGPMEITSPAGRCNIGSCGPSRSGINGERASRAVVHGFAPHLPHRTRNANANVYTLMKLLSHESMVTSQGEALLNALSMRCNVFECLIT
jgi:hypothetical protein